MFHVLNGLWERTQLDALCLAGGCAMNSVANGKIRQRNAVQDLYIQPAAATTALRSAPRTTCGTRCWAGRAASSWSTATGARSTPTPT